MIMTRTYRLLVANEGVLPLLRYGTLRLTRDLLRAEDADDEPWDLLFSVEYEGGVAGGYIERGPAVTSTPRLPDSRNAISKRASIDVYPPFRVV